MKFRFRLDTVMRQRKIERDLAQKEHSDAAAAVRTQLAKIQKMYNTIDKAREKAENIQKSGGSCTSDLVAIENFIVGQKTRIEIERKKARELMVVEEEKLEILVDAAQAFKVLERLKEKKQEEFKIAKRKKSTKQADDMVTMRFQAEDKL